MYDLKELFGSYNICARFAPGFLFITSIYFLVDWDINNLKDNSILFIVLLIILSGVCGFVSASMIKFIERFIWNKFNNPIIRYLKNKEKELYNELLNECKEEKNIITKIKNTLGKIVRLF